MKLTLIICCMAATLAAGQETTPPDLDARRESVVIIKQNLAMREKRLAEVGAAIRENGATIDKKVGELVDMLAGLKDSQSSKRRVSEVKGEAIAGLKRMLQVYKEERRKIVQKLAGDNSVPSEALKKDMATIDALAEKQVARILELVKSMPGGEDISKYETDSTAEYNGVYYENSRVSEEWRQNRRDRVESEKQRREVQQALEKAIADLGQRQGTLKAGLAGKLTAAEKELVEQDLGHVSQLLDQRKAQLAEVTAPSAAAEASASKGEADDLKDLFNNARRDIAEDFAKTIRLYHSAAAERERIHAVKENLAEREKWLQENDPEAKKDQ